MLQILGAPARLTVLLASVALLAGPVLAQTGVSEDRVSLPEGPGSLEGVGENVEIDPNMGTMSYSELMCHPGLRQLGGRYTSWGYRWPVELATLTAEQTRLLVEEEEIDLVGFASLSTHAVGTSDER